VTRRPAIGPDGPSSLVLVLVAAWYGYQVLMHGNVMARFDAWMFAHDEDFRAGVLAFGLLGLMLAPFWLALVLWLPGAIWRVLASKVADWRARRAR